MRRNSVNRTLDLVFHAVIRQMAGHTRPVCYFRLFPKKSVIAACTNIETSTATYNGL